MEFRTLGRTGIQVSVSCMGTMTYGWEPQDWGSEEEAAIKITHRAIDLGINFFDTADVYARGMSETILGKALKGIQRSSYVLATKAHGKMHDTDANAWGNTRKHIMEACDASLARLGVEYIDLYQIHRPQPEVGIDETLRALEDLTRAGKILYAGCSTFAAWQVCEAHYVAKELGARGFVTEQPPYNLLDRRIERELLPFLKSYNYGVIPWSPLAGGILSGKYLDSEAKGSRYSSSDPMGRLKNAPVPKLRKLKALAEKSGMSMATLSLAWVANQPGITSPIIGARSVEQLEESVKATMVKLDPRILNKVDEIFEPGSHHVEYYRASFGPNARPN